MISQTRGGRLNSQASTDVMALSLKSVFRPANWSLRHVWGSIPSFPGNLRLCSWGLKTTQWVPPTPRYRGQSFWHCQPIMDVSHICNILSQQHRHFMLRSDRKQQNSVIILQYKKKKKLDQTSRHHSPAKLTSKTPHTAGHRSLFSTTACHPLALRYSKPSPHTPDSNFPRLPWSLPTAPKKHSFFSKLKSYPKSNMSGVGEHYAKWNEPEEEIKMLSVTCT